jgi:hypothetical protein
MKITQKRIRSLHAHLLCVGPDAVITPALLDLDPHRDRLREIGFPPGLEPGQVLLPAVVGPRTRFNAEGEERVHRDRPKEFVTRLAWARWQERHGNDQRVIRGVRPWNYQRFPRSLVPPPGVELRVVSDGRLAIVAETIQRGVDDERLLHSINLMLELFGECDLLDESPVSLAADAPVSRLNWELIPAGPAGDIPPQLGDLVGALPAKDRRVAEYRIARVEELEPDFVAVGRGGFRGYAVFGFSERGRVVLESLYSGHETVVSDRCWEELSRLSKSELLADAGHEEHIEHSPGWESRLRDAVQP